MRPEYMKRCAVLGLIFILLFSSFSFFHVGPGEAADTEDFTGYGSEFVFPADRWAWEMVGSEYARELGEDGEGVRVAIMDTGIDYNHPALEDNMWDDIGYDFVNDDEDPMDEDGHGTHVAGLVVSVAPRVELMSIKVLEEDDNDDNDEDDFVDLTAAVEFARDEGADIITMSFGGGADPFTGEFESELYKAYEEDDVLLMGAAGNEGEDERFYPAAFDPVIGVSALDAEKDRAPYSNYGDWIDLSGPGGVGSEGIYSTLPGNDHGEKTGTSMATPFVAGAAALIRSRRPYLTNVEIRDFLHETAIELEDDRASRYGLVNVYAAAGGEVPTPVRGLRTEVDDGEVLLDWERPLWGGTSPLEGYRIYRAVEGTIKIELDVIGPDEYDYLDRDVVNGISYEYTVVPFNEKGDSFIHETIEAVPRKEATVPAPPEDIELDISEEGVDISWEPHFDDGGSPLISYNIYREEENGGLRWIGEVDADRSDFLDRTVSSERSYSYVVTAQNEIGESDHSESAEIDIPEYIEVESPPSSPRNLTVELYSRGVELDWEPPSTEGDSPLTNYNVYRKQEDGELKLIEGNVSEKTPYHFDTDLHSGNNYSYVVTAENEMGESKMTVPLGISIPEGHLPEEEESNGFIGYIESITGVEITSGQLLIILFGILFLLSFVLALKARESSH